MSENRTKYILTALGLAAMVASLYLVFLWVPTEQSMGIVQRIFYFHVPTAWVAFLAFFVVFLGSILYLWQRQERWDSLAYASAEIGVLFTTLTLITGSIWAKPIWGLWWTWDPRLTTTLILWLIYVAYLLVRAYTEGPQGARFAAVVGIIGFIDVPIVYMAIRWWRTLHPGPVFGEGGGLDPSMRLTFFVSLATFTLLYVLLMLVRAPLHRLGEEVAELKARVEGE